MARVSIDTGVWTDRRFVRVGWSLGLDHYSVIARMAELWSIATEQERVCLGEFTIQDVFNHPRLVEIYGREDIGGALVEAGLAISCREHEECFLLAGSERLLWLAKKRQTARVNGRKGGRPKKNSNNQRGFPEKTVVQEQEQEQEQLLLTGGSELKDREPAALAAPKRRAEKFDFEAVYKLYPLKKGRARGLKRAKELIRTRPEFDRFAAAVAQVAKNYVGHSTDYLKHFDSFVHQEIWKDEQLPAPNKTGDSHPATGSRDPFRGDA